MVLEKLGGSLREALRKIAGASYVDESLIKEIVRDIQRALIQADVNVQLALGITKQLQRRAVREKPPPGRNPRGHGGGKIYREHGENPRAPPRGPLPQQRSPPLRPYGPSQKTRHGRLG